jgi:hypothetical protein
MNTAETTHMSFDKVRDQEIGMSNTDFDHGPSDQVVDVGGRPTALPLFTV